MAASNRNREADEENGSAPELRTTSRNSCVGRFARARGGIGKGKTLRPWIRNKRLVAQARPPDPTHDFNRSSGVRAARGDYCKRRVSVDQTVCAIQSGSKKRERTNGPAVTLLFLHSSDERQLFGVLAKPDDAVPVPPSHDDFSR